MIMVMMMMMMMMMGIAVRALTAELLDLPTSYVIDVVNSQAVNNADDTWPHIALVENRLRLVRYCSKFNIVFIFYRIYSL